MPTWAEALKLLGLTTPFVYAAATYGLFHWLDKKASGSAKQAMRERIQLGAPQRTTVANFTVEVFDRIYTSPLLHWRACLRSLAITVTVCVLIWVNTGLLEYGVNPFVKLSALLIGWYVVFNALADYVSLFFVRRWLVASSQRPIFGLAIATLVGAGIVYASNLIRGLIYIAYALIISPYNSSFERIVTTTWALFSNPLNDTSMTELLMPAVLVHLWFPLFALAVVLTQALGWLSKAAGWMQWFLKRGQHHPFQAVGLVAAIIVFAVSVVIQVLIR